MLKLGIVTIHPLDSSTESLGTTVFLTEFCKHLADHEVEIHIFTPFGDTQIGDGIFVHKIPSLLFKLGVERGLYKFARRAYSKAWFARILVNKNILEKSILSLANSLLLILKKMDLDLLQGEQEIPAGACIEISKKEKIPVIAHLRNFWPEEGREMGIFKGEDKNYQTLHRLVGKIINEANLTFVGCDYAKNFLEKEYGILNKIKILRRAGFPFIKEKKYRKKLSKIVYSGMISKHEQLGLFIESIPIVVKKLPSAQFFLAGKGDQVKYLKGLSKGLSVRPNFLWFPKKKDLYNFLTCCHIGVIPYPNTLSRRFTYPIKLFDYLSAGLPIVATDIGGWADTIKKEKIGILAEPSPESFAEGILFLLENPELAYQYGQRGINLAKTKFTWNNSVKKALNDYKKLL